MVTKRKTVGFVCPLSTNDKINAVCSTTGVGKSKFIVQALEEKLDSIGKGERKELKKIVRKARPVPAPMRRKRRGSSPAEEAGRAMGISSWRARQIVAGVRE